MPRTEQIAALRAWISDRRSAINHIESLLGLAERGWTVNAAPGIRFTLDANERQQIADQIEAARVAFVSEVSRFPDPQEILVADPIPVPPVEEEAQPG